jgi:hypothetical protein
MSEKLEGISPSAREAIRNAIIVAAGVGDREAFNSAMDHIVGGIAAHLLRTGRAGDLGDAFRRAHAVLRRCTMEVAP